MRNTHVIYEHLHPMTWECVYVGIADCLGGRPYEYKERKFRHKLWMRRLQKQGWYPTDYVQIIDTELDYDTARIREELLIRQRKPKYNIQHK